jgi:hypothetical protein
MNWKGYGRKRPWPYLSYYSNTFLEGLRKTPKNISQDSLSLDREVNPIPAEYKTGVPTARLLRPAHLILFGLIILIILVKSTNCGAPHCAVFSTLSVVSVTFIHMVLFTVGVVSPPAQPPRWRNTYGRPSATAHSIYSQLPSTSGDRLLHPQPEDAP